MSRVLFHVQHLLGVGHVARAAALTRGMLAAGLDVTVVMGGEPVPNADFGRASIVQLPWVRAADTSFKTLLDSQGQHAGPELFERRRDQLLDLYRQTAPAALLIEHYPFGRRKFGLELEPLLAAARGKTPVLCSLRDVLVEKGESAKSAKAVALVRKSFDKVLVHGDRSVLPLELTFPRATEIAEQIVYTGYVVDRRARPSASSTTADGANEIIVSIGGGAVGLDLLEAAIGAKRLGAGANRTWRLLAGANLAEADFDRLAGLAPAGLIVERSRPDFTKLLARAALSISQAGYNTLMDVLQARCRNVLVPFAAGSESEQMFRARVFEQRHLVRVLDEASLSPMTLAAATDAGLAAPPPAKAGSLDLSGVETTARLVLDMINGKRG
jgi:predicted glycosyltransferase